MRQVHFERRATQLGQGSIINVSLYLHLAIMEPSSHLPHESTLEMMKFGVWAYSAICCNGMHCIFMGYIQNIATSSSSKSIFDLLGRLRHNPSLLHRERPPVQKWLVPSYTSSKKPTNVALAPKRRIILLQICMIVFFIVELYWSEALVMVSHKLEWVSRVFSLAQSHWINAQ